MKKIKVSEKVFEILGSVSLFGLDNSANEYQAKQEVAKAILEISDKYDTINFTTRVDDLASINWKSKEHFTKIFAKRNTT